MLTAHQCEIVAFVTDGGIICRDCAVSRFGEMGVAALEEGLAEFLPQDVSPLIRYEVDTYAGELASEHADEVVSYDDDPERWNAEYDGYPGVTCDDCCEVID